MPETAQQILDEFHAFRDTDLREFRKSLEEMKDSLESRISSLERRIKSVPLTPGNPRQAVIDMEMNTILAWRDQFEKVYKKLHPYWVRLADLALACKVWWKSHRPILRKRKVYGCDDQG